MKTAGLSFTLSLQTWGCGVGGEILRVRVPLRSSSLGEGGGARDGCDEQRQILGKGTDRIPHAHRAEIMGNRKSLSINDIYI